MTDTTQNKKKKKKRNVFGFIVTFVISAAIIYTVLSIAVPAWRVPVVQDTMQYLINSWKHMIPVKAAITAVASLLIAWLFTH